MNDAPFAAELYGSAWDFGPLIFEDVILASPGMNFGWSVKTDCDTDCYWQRHWVLHRVPLELQWRNKRQHYWGSVDCASGHCCL